MIELCIPGTNSWPCTTIHKSALLWVDCTCSKYIDLENNQLQRFENCKCTGHDNKKLTYGVELLSKYPNTHVHIL